MVEVATFNSFAIVNSFFVLSAIQEDIVYKGAKVYILNLHTKVLNSLKYHSEVKNPGFNLLQTQHLICGVLHRRFRLPDLFF